MYVFKKTESNTASFPRDTETQGWCPAGPVVTSWGEGASLALIDYPSSDGITTKMPYDVDVLHRPAKTKSGFIC